MRVVIILFLTFCAIASYAHETDSLKTIRTNYSDTLSIDSVIFDFGCGMGSCPSYYLVIAKDRSATYSTEDHRVITHYKTILTATDYDSLAYYIHHAAIDSFGKVRGYRVDDGYERTLTIKYCNGAVKKLEDDTITCGIYSLETLYRYFFSLKKSQHWEKIK
jgi:hypothetical protein